MSRPWRIYYNIVFGGAGGLLAYLLVGSLPDLLQNNLFWELLIGAIAGASIGAWLGAVDGVFDKQIPKAIVGASRGAALGLLGGILGLALGELLFWLTQGGYLGRSIGWGVVGAIVGTTEGIANHAPQKISYGAIGGAIGGLVGGATFEGLTQAAIGLATSADQVAEMQNIAAGLGLVLVGMLIGSIIALAEIIGFRAFVHVIRGKREGKDFDIVKNETAIGGDDSNDIPLYEPELGKRIALLIRKGKQIMLHSSSGRVSLIHPGEAEPKLVMSDQPLSDGDKIGVGKTILQFRQRKRG